MNSESSRIYYSFPKRIRNPAEFIFEKKRILIWHVFDIILVFEYRKYSNVAIPDLSTIKKVEMKDFSTQCCLNLWKKLEKIVVYEFNISFALIFRKRKMVLSNLTLGISN